MANVTIHYIFRPYLDQCVTSKLFFICFVFFILTNHFFSSLAPIARYASFWNVSVITVSAQAQEFRKNKFSEYKTLTNVGPTMYWLDRFIINLFAHFGWKKVILIFDKEHQEPETNFNCFLTMASLKAALFNANVVVDYKILDRLDPRPVEKILEEFVGNKYSIILLCGDHNFVMNIMLAAKSLGFINGEYAFINIDLYAQLHHENRLLRPWLNTKSHNESVIQSAISAYDALLTVTLKFDTQVDKYSEFKRKLINYDKSVYKSETKVCQGKHPNPSMIQFFVKLQIKNILIGN